MYCEGPAAFGEQAVVADAMVSIPPQSQGFLGIGDDHYPLPWQTLKYDTGLGR
jgi:hypothetical protein